ncbi:MAG TPA: alpha/beta hydrolase [Ramlibacter sp.]|uniref:alpha/beta fold hydrolase n=1 Tax=Ramlibacter sp. TaxID=1917967 RepID=UPI002C9F2A78|nr:alpha/beta hydrolase [Ramlibacter sp.]HVZ44927.1 alpha/beta hydrolase [Ramlibacter sp.]
MPMLESPRGHAIHYEVDDFTDAWRDAPSLVLQHGLGRSSTLWRGWVPYLSRWFRIVRLDLRGCGRSGDAPARSLDDYVEDILGVAAHVEASTFHYCGDSLGGILGMKLAAEHPRKVRTLTLLSSPVFLDEQNLSRVALGRRDVHAALDELGSQGWADAMHDGVLMSREPNPAMAAWFAQDMGSSRLNTLHEMFSVAMAADARPLLPRIEAPVLGLYPTHGTLTSTLQEELLRQHVKNLRYIRLPSPYHMAQHVAPATCALQLLHFAAQADGTACRE